MQVPFKIINAFSIVGKGGNPAGLVLEADQYTREQKQAIAAKAGLSETAFVSASTVADVKLEFFTPSKQIPHCGHATIATFSYLKNAKKIDKTQSSKETIDGIRQIFFQQEEAYMEQKAPTFIQPDKKDALSILQCLGLEQQELIEGVAPTIVNTGNAFLLVGVNSEAILERIVPNLTTIHRLSIKYGLIGFYVYALVHDRGVQATTRMFGPLYGIAEEAATGMAAGPLACFLYTIHQIKRQQYLIEQGKYMPHPSASLIKVNVLTKADNISGLYAGGSAYTSKEIVIKLC